MSWRFNRGRSDGFTLVELMVVAAIIVILLAVTMPAIKSMLDSSQQAQAENLVRANLLAARAYAMSNAVLSGLRFQDDGRIIQVYASNYLTAFNAVKLRVQPPSTTPPSREKPTYEMKAIDGRQADLLPGHYRVIADDYDRNQLDRSTLNWWVGERWYSTCAILFSARGRGIQARCVFPEGWYPSTDGAFGDYTYDTATGDGTVYENQGRHGTDNPATGPNVNTAFRIYDSSTARGLLASGTVTGGSVPYTLGDSILQAKAAIENSATDFVVNVGTGAMIRRNATVDSDIN